MMAQASAFLSVPLIGTDLSGINVETLLLAVDKSKFRRPILPGMDLEIKAQFGKGERNDRQLRGRNLSCTGKDR